MQPRASFNPASLSQPFAGGSGAAAKTVYCTFASDKPPPPARVEIPSLARDGEWLAAARFPSWAPRTTLPVQASVGARLELLPLVRSWMQQSLSDSVSVTN